MGFTGNIARAAYPGKKTAPIWAINAGCLAKESCASAMIAQTFPAECLNPWISDTALNTI